MKKMFSLLVILSIIYFIIQISFSFIEKGHIENYKVETEGKTFEIKEEFTVNTKEDDNYYLEITVDDITFDFQTFENLNLSKRIVTDVYYYDRDFKCILPIIEKNIVSDLICKEGDIYYNYTDLKGKSSSLDLYVSTLEEKGYYINNYITNNNILTNKDGITVYDNLLENHYLSIENYKGIYTINNRNLNHIHNNLIFNNDVYNKKISCYVDDYYLVAFADYQKQTKFNIFKLVNLVNNQVEEIKYDYDISLDSYVLGTYNHKVYIFDNDTKKEYEVDIKKGTIIEVGNPEIGIKIYKNGTFENVNAYTVYQNKITFDNYNYEYTFNNKNYSLVIKNGLEKSGYYYIFEKYGNNYKVYRSNIQNGINKTYLFITNSTNLVYDKDNVYYIDGKNLKRYNNKTGNKVIMEYKELEFNHNIKIGLFNK